MGWGPIDWSLVEELMKQMATEKEDDEKKRTGEGIKNNQDK